MSDHSRPPAPLPSDQPSLGQGKSVLRQAALEARGKAHRALGTTAAAAFLDHFLADIQPAPTAIVAGYFPIRSEADVVPLLDKLSQLGHTCALPRVLGAENPLTFHQWEPGSPTASGPFGTRVPLSDTPEVVPDIVLVPLLAFDLVGTRLGYGGGFYDRTLSRLRKDGACLAVGIAFSAQERDLLPRDPYDEALDWVVTEVGCRRFERMPE